MPTFAGPNRSYFPLGTNRQVIPARNPFELQWDMPAWFFLYDDANGGLAQEYSKLDQAASQAWEDWQCIDRVKRTAETYQLRAWPSAAQIEADDWRRATFFSRINFPNPPAAWLNLFTGPDIWVTGNTTKDHYNKAMEEAGKGAYGHFEYSPTRNAALTDVLNQISKARENAYRDAWLRLWNWERRWRVSREWSRDRVDQILARCWTQYPTAAQSVKDEYFSLFQKAEDLREEWFDYNPGMSFGGHRLFLGYSPPVPDGPYRLRHNFWAEMWMFAKRNTTVFDERTLQGMSTLGPAWPPIWDRMSPDDQDTYRGLIMLETEICKTSEVLGNEKYFQNQLSLLRLLSKYDYPAGQQFGGVFARLNKSMDAQLNQFANALDSASKDAAFIGATARANTTAALEEARKVAVAIAPIVSVIDGFLKAGVVVAGALTGGALLAPLAGAVGVTGVTSSIGTAVGGSLASGDLLGAVTGAAPVAAPVLKNMGPSLGVDMNLLDSLKQSGSGFLSSISTTSLSGIISGVQNTSLSDLGTKLVDTALSVKPADVVQTLSDAKASSSNPSISAPTIAAVKAAVPTGAIIALLAYLYFSKKG